MEEKLARLVDEMQTDSNEKLVQEYSNLNDRFISLGGLTYKKEYQTMIRKFKFTEEDEQKPVSEFSGGQRTKISFIKMLLSKPDILLLDEPTNHLDIETIEWLEEYLKAYKSALVIVSHDRMFLNKIVDKVYEIEWGETRCYKGDYSAFEKQKRERHIKQQKDHDLQRAEIERLTKLIERFRYKATKASMVQSKIKLLEKMQIVDAPDRYDTRTFRASTTPKIESSRQVLNVNNLVISF
jgi:ATP-binding cassette subfamily F protein 3